MSNLDVRMLVYTALVILCSVIGVTLGLAAAVYTFMQIAAVTEFIYWFGSSRRMKGRRRFQLI